MGNQERNRRKPPQKRAESSQNIIDRRTLLLRGAAAIGLGAALGTAGYALLNKANEQAASNPEITQEVLDNASREIFHKWLNEQEFAEQEQTYSFGGGTLRIFTNTDTPPPVDDYIQTMETTYRLLESDPAAFRVTPEEVVPFDSDPFTGREIILAVSTLPASYFTTRNTSPQNDLKHTIIQGPFPIGETGITNGFSNNPSLPDGSKSSNVHLIAVTADLPPHPKCINNETRLTPLGTNTSICANQVEAGHIGLAHEFFHQIFRANFGPRLNSPLNDKKNTEGLDDEEFMACKMEITFAETMNLGELTSINK